MLLLQALYSHMSPTTMRYMMGGRFSQAHFVRSHQQLVLGGVQQVRSHVGERHCVMPDEHEASTTGFYCVQCAKVTCGQCAFE